MNNYRKKLIALFITIVLILAIVPLQSCMQTPPAEPDRGNDATESTESTTLPTAAETVPDSKPEISDQGLKGRFVLAGTTELSAESENPYQIWLDLPFSAEEGIDVWSLTQQILNDHGYIYVESEWGNHIQKLTPPSDSGQIELEAAVTNGPDSSWMWSYNDNMDQAAHEYLVRDGDEIRWYFTNDWSQEYSGHPESYLADEGNIVAVEADAERPSDWEAWWPAFAASMEHNNTKELALSLGGFEVDEVFTLQQEGDWFDTYSDPIQVEEWIYVVYSDTLLKLEADGSIAESAQLQFAIDSTSRIAYADGLVLVPMKYGKVQAFTADNLSTVWIADAPDQILVEDAENSGNKLPHAQQSLTSLTVADGIIYQGLCTVGWSERSFGGVYRALDLDNGSVIWEYRSEETGFYWSGGAIKGDTIYVGNDFGEILAFNRLDGIIIDKISLPEFESQPPAIRSNMVIYEDFLFFVSQQDGSLNRIDISGGSFGCLQQVQFSNSSTASPTILDGKVYVAGNDALVIIDADSMQIDKSYEVEGYIQSTPLVIKDSNEKVYIYFTINDEFGAVYAVAADSDNIHTVYMPIESQQNYCMETLSVSPDGTLFYTNDSHTFFALQLLSDD